jgi:CNT family concentrative nucleoside transporter
LELRSLAGIFVLVGIAYAISLNRKAISWRIVAGGTFLQIVFALVVLRTAAGKAFFFAVNDVIVALLGFAKDGSRFVFGNLVDNNVPVGTPIGGLTDTMGPVLPDAVTGLANVGAFFAFSVLPTIIFFSAFMAVLYYFGVMQIVVRGFSWIMMKTLKTSGAETLSASANIFVGQTEAPLIVRPYLAKMTRSELFCVMTGGFATVAGGVMAAYVGFLYHKFPTIAGHLMAASVMSAPAALVMAKIMCPETDRPETAGGTGKVDIPKTDSNVLDATTRGATEGMALAFNVAAMLIAFIALIALVDKLIALGSPWAEPILGGPLSAIGVAPFPSSLKEIFGWCFAPLAWIMGVRSVDCVMVGQLMGTKTVVNEFVAFLDMAALVDKMSPRSAVIAIYALCGFANFSSIGIQIGGISALVPERRHDLAKIGLRAMIAGALACFMTGTIAGMIETEESSLLMNRVPDVIETAPVSDAPLPSLDASVEEAGGR